eukprot:PITA_16444
MDVKTTFLHEDLEEDIYMKQPEGFEVKGKKELCPKTQEEEVDMSRVPYASAVGSLMYAMVYTRLGIAHAVGVLSRFMSKPGKEHWIEMKRVFMYLCGTSDYGLCYQGRPRLDRVLDIRVFVDADWAGDLDQRRSTIGYVFNLFGGAVSWMSKKQSVVALSTIEVEYMVATHASKEAVWLRRLCSRKEHWTTVKRVFRYLRGTHDYGLCYQGRPGLDRVLDIRVFVDAEWAGDLDQRRSTSGYVFNLFGGAVSWMSKKQSVVALSTTEAEYMAATHASKEAVWLQRLCSSMGLVQGAIRIDCDSQSAIFLGKNPAYHSKTKHIDVQYHFVRDMIEDKRVSLVKVDTLKNTTDALTKSVSSEKFSWCRETMGISGLEK